MDITYRLKQLLIFIFIIVIIGAVFYTIKSKKGTPIIIENNPIVENTGKQPIDLCYYHGVKTDRNFYDVAWLKMSLTGGNVTGEFRNLPAEKDSKVGKFYGTVGSLDQKSMSREADVWWDNEAEGMKAREELLISFGDGSAAAGFGEMVDRGDGVYVYKDKANISYSIQMNQIDCESLDEKLFVEKYITDNIKDISSVKPVLGGQWFVLSVSANPMAHTAEVTYEDGHIQNTAKVIYTYTKSPQSVTVSNFEIVKKN